MLRVEYELPEYEPEATNCFSVNFKLNIMILSRKFCVYLHFTPLFTSWRTVSMNFVIKRQSKFL